MRNHFSRGPHPVRLQHFVAPHPENRSFVNSGALQNPRLANRRFRHVPLLMPLLGIITNPILPTARHHPYPALYSSFRPCLSTPSSSMTKGPLARTLLSSSKPSQRSISSPKA